MNGRDAEVRYVIRTAHQNDGAALSDFAIDTVDEAQGPYATRRRGAPLSPSAFESSVVLVAESTPEKRLLGFVAIRFTAIAETPGVHAGRRADITMLGIVPDMRRRGIGRDLISHALKLIETWKATLITLCVAEQNQAAIRLYESMGWIVIDRTMTFPVENLQSPTRE